MTNRKEYMKEYMKAWKASHKEQHKAYRKAYYQVHKEEHKAKMKEWNASHKEQLNNWQKAYQKADLNSLGQTKTNIRNKSNQYLSKYVKKIPGYEIHHAFGYDDPYKFIYISKALHLKIHKYLRDNNIPADTNHWMIIRDLVNSTNEFTYIKC